MKREKIALFVVLGIFALMVLSRIDDKLHPVEAAKRAAEQHWKNVENDALTECQVMAGKDLAAPATADFAGTLNSRVTEVPTEAGQPGRTFRVQSYVDAQNRYGAKLRKPFTCVLRTDDAQHFQGSVDWFNHVTP